MNLKLIKMKTIKHLLLIAISLTVMLSACTIEKRIYMPGYSILWNKSIGKTDRQNFVKSSAAQDVKSKVNNIVEETEAVEQRASSVTGIAATNNNKINVPAFNLLLPVSNTEKELKAIPDRNIGNKTIEYAKYNDKYSVPDKYKKGKLARNPTPSNGKSQRRAAWLCACLGYLGVHRFYLGYVGIGIIELLTFGGFSIWAIIDFIRIEEGTLKPKYWHYQRTR